MYSRKTFAFTMIITTVLELSTAQKTFDPNNVTAEDLNRLKREYPRFLEYKLKRHDFYANEYPENLDAVVCPKPWDNSPKENNVLFFEDMKVVGKKVSDLLEPKFSEELFCESGSYVKRYATVLNAIESVGLTTIYKYCSMALKLNLAGNSIAEIKGKFFDFLNDIEAVFQHESISTEHIICVTVVYINYDVKHKKHDKKYTKPDEEYMDGLSECMEAMRPKIDFVDLGDVVTLEDDVIDLVDGVDLVDVFYVFMGQVKIMFQKTSYLELLYDIFTPKI